LGTEQQGAESQTIFEASQRVMPGGVSSPVRAFRSVGGSPFIAARGEGCYLHDVDGNRYIDYVGSWGPLILGHAQPAVVEAITDAARRGSSFGCPTRGELELCELLVEIYDSIDMVRLVNSGTEATMSAIRLARGYTQRPMIVKFDGCYHGHVDSLLVKAGSGLATFGVPSSAGIPEDLSKHTLSLPFNDLDVLRTAFEEHGGEIAGIIVEPVAGNMGCIPPADGFLELMRELCDEHGAVLIFDEVMTGSRVALGGAQSRFGIRPDLTALGKVVGGGLPLAAYGGREEIMAHISPLGSVYQAGTLSGNPLAVAAGLATMRQLADDPETTYRQLEASSARLARGLLEACEGAGVPATLNRVGSMMTLFFGGHDVVDQATSSRGDDALYARFFHGMLERGVYLAPSRYECAFVSLAHDEAAIDATLDAAREAVKPVADLL